MLSVISTPGRALALNFTSFVLCRFLAGIAIGGSSVPIRVPRWPNLQAGRSRWTRGTRGCPGRGIGVRFRWRSVSRASINSRELMLFCTTWATFSQRGSATYWIFNALIAGSFPVIAAHSKAAPFAFFASVMVLQFIAAFFLMPETRGVALERINEQLHSAERKVSRRNM
jgi:hypothetical protein